MARLFVLVEGPTEETFVNEVLAPHLYRVGWTAVTARIVGNARQRARRGGIRRWPSMRQDITRHLREDPDCHVTTLVDYYAMPADWPGRADAARLPATARADSVEARIGEEVGTELGPNFDARRLVPFIMMHEFEALLFSDCQAFARGIGQPGLGGELQGVRDRFGHPEEIDDSPETAPSKRLLGIVPGYDKPLCGSVGALEIGFEPMRRECPHFGAWMDRLERLVAPAA